jgi:putative oxidoreductase
MDALRRMLDRLDALSVRLLARSGLRLDSSITLLRISLGLIFLGFGALKFVPGLSPVEDLVERTVQTLSLGLVPGSIANVLIGTLETTIGLLLLTGRYLRLGLTLLSLTMLGILSPIVLFPDRLFAGPANAPTLEGQYVLKDIVLLAAAFVVAACAVAGSVGGDRAKRAKRKAPSGSLRLQGGTE